jgi:hypothetical protein
MKLVFWLVMSVAIGLGAAVIATAVVWHTGGIVLLPGGLIGLLFGVLVLALMEDECEISEPWQLLPLLLGPSLLMFFLSWAVLPKDFAILRTGDEITLSEGTFIVPYKYERVSYIGDFTVRTVAVLPREGKEIQWDVVARLEFVADYEQSFNLLERFGDKESWEAAAQEVVEEGVREFVTKTFTPDQSLPSKFSFSLTENQIAKLRTLGFSPRGDVRAKNVRIIIKGG